MLNLLRYRKLLKNTLIDRFTQIYNGFPAAVFNNSLEYNNFTAMLKMESISFKTKIVKHKRRGREFVVMLVEEVAQNA